MKLGMFVERHELKILKSVVSFVSVFVMHSFAAQKWSTNMLFHYEAMLQYVMAFTIDPNVPIFGKRSGAPEPARDRRIISTAELTQSSLMETAQNDGVRRAHASSDSAAWYTPSYWSLTHRVIITW